MENKIKNMIILVCTISGAACIILFFIWKNTKEKNLEDSRNFFKYNGSLTLAHRKLRLTAKIFHRMIDEGKYLNAFLFMRGSSVPKDSDYFRFLTQVQKYKKRYGIINERYVVSELYAINPDEKNGTWHVIICSQSKNGRRFFEKIDMFGYSGISTWLPFERAEDANEIQRYDTPLGRLFLSANYELKDRLVFENQSEEEAYQRTVQKRDECIEKTNNENFHICKDMAVFKIQSSNIYPEGKDRIDKMIDDLLQNTPDSILRFTKNLYNESYFEYAYAMKVLKIKNLEWFGTVVIPFEDSEIHKRYNYIYKAELESLRDGQNIDGTLELEIVKDRVKFRVSCLSLDQHTKYYARLEETILKTGAIDSGIFLDPKRPTRMPEIEDCDKIHFDFKF